MTQDNKKNKLEDSFLTPGQMITVTTFHNGQRRRMFYSDNSNDSIKILHYREEEEIIREYNLTKSDAYNMTNNNITIFHGPFDIKDFPITDYRFKIWEIANNHDKQIEKK